MLDGNKTTGTVELGDGVTFEITGAYNGTFKGLTGDGWKISERVAGYVETITVPESVTGQVAINNKKTLITQHHLIQLNQRLFTMARDL